MLLNAEMIEKYITSKEKGVKAIVGIDLTVQKMRRIVGGSLWSDKTELDEYEDLEIFTHIDGRLFYSLEPGGYSVTFEQGIQLPDNVTGFIRHRSSMVRMGATITSGVFDPNFYTDNMGAVLFTIAPISIELKSRVAQLILMENYATTHLYNGQWQGSKDYK